LEPESAKADRQCVEPARRPDREAPPAGRGKRAFERLDRRPVDERACVEELFEVAA